MCQSTLRLKIKSGALGHLDRFGNEFNSKDSHRKTNPFQRRPKFGSITTLFSPHLLMHNSWWLFSPPFCDNLAQRAPTEAEILISWLMLFLGKSPPHKILRKRHRRTNARNFPPISRLMRRNNWSEMSSASPKRSPRSRQRQDEANVYLGDVPAASRSQRISIGKFFGLAFFRSCQIDISGIMTFFRGGAKL